MLITKHDTEPSDKGEVMSVNTLTNEQYKALSTERLKNKLQDIADDDTQTVEARGSATNAQELLDFDQYHADQIIHGLCYWSASSSESTRRYAKDLTRIRNCWKQIHGIDSA